MLVSLSIYAPKDVRNLILFRVVVAGLDAEFAKDVSLLGPEVLFLIVAEARRI